MRRVAVGAFASQLESDAGGDSGYQDRRFGGRHQLHHTRIRGARARRFLIKANLNEKSHNDRDQRLTESGIDDIERARQPFYSTAGDADRSGMGFTVMETFMDEVNVISALGKGTTVIMRKSIDRGLGGYKANMLEQKLLTHEETLHYLERSARNRR